MRNVEIIEAELSSERQFCNYEPAHKHVMATFFDNIEHNILASVKDAYGMEHYLLIVNGVIYHISDDYDAMAQILIDKIKSNLGQ